MKKLFLTLLISVVGVLATFAAKSNGQIHTVVQPDGTTLMVRLIGDEHFSWHQTTDGVLLKWENNAYYIATIATDGTLMNSGILAHNRDLRSEEEQMAAISQDKSLFRDAAIEADNEAVQRRIIDGYPSASRCPHSGVVHVPVILMNYSDMPLTYNDQATWQEYFNGSEFYPYTKDTRYKGYGSVASYFMEASYGNLEFVFDIYGPYTADNGHDYYGYNSGKSLNLLTEAVEKADADIDFSQYDSNDDGNVDMVYIVFAGTGRNLSGSDLDFHPACWSGLNVSTSEGKRINILGGANELALSAADNNGTALRAGIGVTCHEISHGLGLPDLYWTLSSVPTDAQGYPDYNNCGPEDWDVMDGGENIYNAFWPCQYSAWEREIMGWMQLEELTGPTNVTVYPLNTDQGNAFRVTNPANEYEYYVIENVCPNNNDWNYYLDNRYGSGLIITHVNATSYGLSMACNTTYGKPNVTILPADGFILGAYSIGETIPYQGEVQEITSSMFRADAQGDPYLGTKYAGTPVTALAAYNNYTGDEMVEQYPITDIVRNDDGSISFKFMGGVEVNAISNTPTVDSDAAVYNLQGQRVSAGYKGITITNGRKHLR